jgi:hypothetical protein
MIWLILELVAYFGLSPFPAVRRVMGLVLVLTLLGGRLASGTCQVPDRRRVLRCIAGAGVVLGLLFYAIDFADARALQEGALRAARAIREKTPDARIWYVGHWGFQFYAERAGMMPMVPSATGAPHADLGIRVGDWLVSPDPRVHAQKVLIDPKRLELNGAITVDSPFEVGTVEPYYIGTTPLRSPGKPRLIVSLSRFTSTVSSR